MKRFLMIFLAVFLLSTAFAQSFDLLSYPESVDVYPGEYSLFAVGAYNNTSNTGIVSIDSVSGDSRFTVVPFPESASLAAHGDAVFFIGFNVPSDMPEGQYTISVDFSFNSESKSISLPVHVLKPDIVIESETDDVSLLRNGSVGIPFTVENKSDSVQCIDFSSFSDEYSISTNVSREQLCLNKGEKTTVTLAIVTYFSPVGIFDVSLTANYAGEQVSKNIVVKVTGKEVEFVPSGPLVCAGSTHTTDILVKNNTNRAKHVLLRADNELFLPSFTQTTVELAPFSERYVQLEFYVPSKIEAGNYAISIFADSGSSTYADELDVEVEHCGVSPANSFSLSLSSAGCISIDKNHSSKIYFQISNNLDEVQEVHVSVDSDLPTTVPGSFSLQPNETKYCSFDVNARLDDDVGNHSVSVYAWNERKSVVADQCIIVRKLRQSNASLVSDNFIEIEQGSMGIYIFRIENHGDYDDDFNLSVSKRPRKGESVRFSRSDFEVEQDETADVYVSVSIPCDMNIGDYDLNILVKRNNRVILRKNLSFTNNSGEEINGLRLALLYLPSGVKISPNRFDLGAGEIVNISGKISAEHDVLEGEYSGKIELFAGDVRTISDISVYVNYPESGKENEQDEEQGFFGIAGLFSLGTGFLIGLVVLLLIALLLVGSGNNSKNEIEWLGR